MKFSFIHKRKVQIVLRFIVDFLKHNPIHCTSYLAKTQIHWSEFMYWMVALLIFLVIGLLNGMDLIVDYMSRNSALSTNIASRPMKTFYPSLTLCPHDILDRKKINKLKGEHIKHLLLKDYSFNKILKKIRKMEKFLQNLSKSTPRQAYPNVTSPFTIPPKDYMQLIFNLSRHYDVRVEDKTAVKIMTEVGICYTINNELSKHLYTKYWQDLEPYPKNFDDRFTTDTFIFSSKFPLKTKITHNITGNITVYAHSAHEVPTVWTRPVLIIDNNNKNTYILKTAIQQFSNDETAIKKKSIDYMNFQNINESNLNPFKSSRNLCIMECRAGFIKKLCNCLPHFYAHTYWNDTNICNTQGINCYNRYLEIIRTINTNTMSPIFRCDDCRSNDIEQIVVVKINQHNKQSKIYSNTSEIIFQIEHPPIQSYTRSIMYNKYDYVVSLSGALSSFFGFTIHGLFDFFYFFSIRIYWFRKGFRGAIDEFIEF